MRSFIIVLFFLSSCISKKDISIQETNCTPSDSCTFHFTITETHDKLDIIDPVPFFTIFLLPRQGIGGLTDFEGEYSLTLKRPISESKIDFHFGMIYTSDTISIDINDCEEEYFQTYDLPKWFKDSLRVDYGKVIKLRSMPQKQ